MKIKKLNLVLAFLFVLVGFVSAHGEDITLDHHDSSMMDGIYGAGFTGAFGFVFMIIVLVALVLLIIWLVKKIQKK